MLADYMFTLLHILRDKKQQESQQTDLQKYIILSQTQAGFSCENGILDEQNLSPSNPVDRSTLELKYQLFNKKNWRIHKDYQAQDSKQNQNMKQYQYIQNFLAFFVKEGASNPSLNLNSIEKFLVDQESQKIHHEEKFKSFNDLMIDIFNNNQDDSYITQMTLSLISRYNSENSEFFRNVGKSFLITDQKTYDIKQAIQFQINQLAHSLQKSSIWPFIEQPIPENEIIELLQNLKKFKNLFMFEQEIDKNDKNDFKSVNSSKKRKVLKVYQNIFRCLKGYDIILNFIQHNKKVFQEIQKKLNSIKTNWDYSQELNDNKINNYKVIQKVFKYCFQILEGFTRHNSKNQRNERQDQNTFETGIIILEILSFILQGDETGNSREILKKYFNLEQMIEYKNGTLNMMQTYLDEGRYNEGKIEEIKDRFFHNITYIYSNLFLSNKDYEEKEIKLILDFYNGPFQKDFIKQCQLNLVKLDIQDDQEIQISVPELKYLLCFSQRFVVEKIKLLLPVYNENSQNQSHMTKKIKAGLLTLTNAYKNNIQSILSNENTRPINKLWKNFVKSMIRNDKHRGIAESESQEFGKSLYIKLHQNFINHNEQEDQQKEVKFIYNLIQYLQKCDKSTWTVYNIIFCLKSMRHLQKLSNNDKQSKTQDYKRNLITHLFDSQYNFKMLVNNLQRIHENQYKTHYQELVFQQILNYNEFQDFETWQHKFLNYFIAKNQSEHFFKYINHIFKISIDKLRKRHVINRYQSRNSHKNTFNKIFYHSIAYEFDVGESMKQNKKTELLQQSAFFFKNAHNNNFNNQVLFINSNKQLMDKRDKSFYQIEIGFMTLFLLRKIQQSMRFDKDDYYHKNILHLLPQIQRYKTPRIIFITKLNHLLFGYFQFMLDILKQLYQYFQKLVHTTTSIQEFYKNEVIKEMLLTLDQHSGKIQIVRDNNTLQSVFFIKMPYCKFQSMNEKESFLQTVDRTNAQSKVEGLMKAHRSFIQQMRQDASIQSISFIGLLSKYEETWAITSFVLVRNFIFNLIQSLVINMLILFSYYEQSSTTTTTSPSNPNQVRMLQSQNQEKKLGDASADLTDKLMKLFGILILVSCLFLIIHHSFSKLPIHYGLAFHPEKYYQVKAKSQKHLNHLPKSRIQKCKELIRKTIRFLTLILQDFPLMYHFVCVIFAILGVGSHMFFYAFHLSYFIISSSTLFNVMRSIWEPKYKIFMTLVLFVLVEYIFTVVSFTNYRSEYPAENCSNLLRCFLVTIDQTFKQNGGVGSFMDAPYKTSSDDDDGQQQILYSRLVYDFLFNFFLIILIVQMISGIIIDKFGALRERDENIERDSKTVCFICGQTKEQIDKQYDGRGGFMHHINFEHNMWNYIYYCAYLDEKRKRRPKELRDMEKEILRKIDNYDNSWIPAYLQDFLIQIIILQQL
eukprot:403371295